MDTNLIRKDFPILATFVNNKPLVYLDNAATTQKPQVVIDTLVDYYTNTNSNIHRGVHRLSQEATKQYEDARIIVQKFINAKHSEEIIFTRGATESVNLVAATFGDIVVNAGDEVLISHLEHHANIVPWQVLCHKKNATLKVIPINDSGEILLDEYEKMLSSKTKIVAVSHISNALGTITPIAPIIEMAHSRGIPVLLDTAQSIQHIPIDVQQMDCDFIIASGHKMYGPTGIGFLYGKREHLDKMQPYQTGGDMILSVSFEKTIYNDLPYKFEAGTPNIAGAIGLGKAIEYIQKIGLDAINGRENGLLAYGTEILQNIDGLHIIGTSAHKSSIISFVLDGIHPHDIGTFLDADGIAVRTGHHCAEPTMHRFGIPATTRISVAFYNTKEELDAVADSIRNVITMFR
ncbi:MAG: cysteine desulfurase [Ignavibacteria bacterium]|nr:cysteine desulfurase [Ignavibacteria bacterium]